MNVVQGDPDTICVKALRRILIDSQWHKMQVICFVNVLSCCNEYLSTAKKLHLCTKYLIVRKVSINSIRIGDNMTLHSK